MNKLTAAISTICLGAAGFSGAAVAGVPTPDFGCNESGSMCAGPDLYEVSLNCDNLEDPVTGGLSIGWDGDGTFDLFVADVGGIICEIHGYMDSSKTEVKCTEADKGPNKSTGRGKANHTTGAKQADAEIKLEEAGAAECVPG